MIVSLIWVGLIITYIVSLIRTISIYNQVSDYLSSKEGSQYTWLCITVAACMIAGIIAGVVFMQEKLHAYATALTVYTVASIVMLFVVFNMLGASFSVLGGGYSFALILIAACMFISVFMQASQCRKVARRIPVGGSAFVPGGLYLTGILIRLAVFKTLGDTEGILENIAWILILFISGIYLVNLEDDLAHANSVYGYSGGRTSGYAGPSQMNSESDALERGRWKCYNCKALNPNYSVACQCGMTREESEAKEKRDFEINKKNAIARLEEAKKREQGTGDAGSIAGQNLKAAEALGKFKELLDMGVITREEFDERKKQLLTIAETEPVKKETEAAPSSEKKPEESKMDWLCADCRTVNSASVKCCKGCGQIKMPGRFREVKPGEKTDQYVDRVNKLEKPAEHFNENQLADQLRRVGPVEQFNASQDDSDYTQVIQPGYAEQMVDQMQWGYGQQMGRQTDQAQWGYGQQTDQAQWGYGQQSGQMQQGQAQWGYGQQMGQQADQAQWGYGQQPGQLQQGLAQTVVCPVCGTQIDPSYGYCYMCGSILNGGQG